ncbi:MAG: DUF885 domain-containing protein [Acidobacteria bacterium]|nr:DUF885 domain-containing protein [Acidobacteriota bacterium]
MHQYDDQLEDYSAQALNAEAAALKDFADRMAAFDLTGAPVSVLGDRDLVVNRTRGRLLEIQSIRQWEKNPDVYSSAASRSIFTLISRDFAPAPQRLKSVIARERETATLFDAARANLKNPPRIYTEIALQQLPGIIGFFRNDVPGAFKDVKDEGLLSEFRVTNQAVIAGLESYQKFLKEDVLPKSNGNFAIGADNYARKLEYDEMVNIPLDRLLQIGYDDLHRNQQELKAAAAKVDPKKTPEQVLAMLGSEHDSPDRLLDDFRATFNGLRAFIEQKKVVDMPSQAEPVLRETPPFMRALTFASMNSPGPYEKTAREAFFSVTLPEPSWTPQQVSQQMEFFNRYAVSDISIHEAFPGHFTQFLFVRDVPSKIRKLMGCSSNAEGWAHYSEQMMLDEGYGNGDPKLRASQLQQAMIRDARYIVGISMHTGKMTLEQGMDFFVNEAHMPRGPAEREAKRGTSDPTYLVYTLGKLEILKLRDDVRKAKGTSFNLEQFHDEFLKQGYPPIRLIRREMLGSDGQVL